MLKKILTGLEVSWVCILGYWISNGDAFKLEIIVLLVFYGSLFQLLQESSNLEIYQLLSQFELMNNFSSIRSFLCTNVTNSLWWAAQRFSCISLLQLSLWVILVLVWVCPATYNRKFAIKVLHLIHFLETQVAKWWTCWFCDSTQVFVLDELHLVFLLQLAMVDGH